MKYLELLQYNRQNIKAHPEHGCGQQLCFVVVGMELLE